MFFDYERFWKVANGYRSYHRRWREGQILFNALSTVSKKQAELITGSDLDPYYDDSRVGKFIEYIQNLPRINSENE